MSFTAPTGGSGNFQLPPSGSHVARLIKLIDMGTTFNEMYGVRQRKMAWAFELVDTLMSPDEEGNQRPFIVYDFLTRSMNEKANLRKFVESWRGAAFANDEEAGNYPVDKLLGKPCYLSIIHGKKKNGQDKADISSIIALPNGMEAKAAINDLVLFDLDDFNQAVFDTLSDGIKANIQKSDEYQARNNSPEEVPDNDFDDDIPF